MTRLEALTALKKAVEAGKVSHAAVEEMAISVFGLGENALNFGQAYGRKRLDAARALHEAVLPGWWATIQQCGENNHVTVEYGDEYGVVNQACPARAWLLAILSALIAQEQEQ